MSTLKLTYFDFSGGRAEPARLAFHIGGIAFEDYRFVRADFEAVKRASPLGQVPTLTIDGVAVTQSDAITRYAGKLAGLYPTDPLQALFCDEIMAALEDVVVKIGATFRLQGEELKTARLALAGEVFPKYLRWLEGQLVGHGGEFLADNRLTVADLKALTVLRWISSGMLDHIPTDIIENCAPKLRQYVDRIASLPQVSHYYASLAKGK